MAWRRHNRSSDVRAERCYNEVFEKRSRRRCFWLVYSGGAMLSCTNVGERRAPSGNHLSMHVCRSGVCSQRHATFWPWHVRWNVLQRRVYDGMKPVVVRNTKTATIFRKSSVSRNPRDETKSTPKTTRFILIRPEARLNQIFTVIVQLNRNRPVKKERQEVPERVQYSLVLLCIWEQDVIMVIHSPK